MYKSLSLFSGIGGLCEGVKLAGFDVQGAVEMDKYASESYRANFPNIPLFEGDVTQFLLKGTAQYEQEKAVFVKEKIDLLFGGPPCQGFSQIGPRDPFDPRNELYLQLCRLAEDLNPKIILIENVPNMLLMKGGMFKQRIISALEKAGYGNVGLLKLCADEYGVPQSRQRVFFIAVKDGFISQSAQGIFEEISNEMKQKSISVNQAISDLPAFVAADSGLTLEYPALKQDCLTQYQKEMRLDTNGKLYSKREKLRLHNLHADKVVLCNHHTKEVQERRAEIISLLRPGAKADSLPKHLWDNKRPEKWRRFDGEKPAHTLLAHMHRDLSEWVHPMHNRWITVREALRLQSFHDGFVLVSSEWQQLKQVGNAVPPLLGRIPAMAAMAILELGYKKNKASALSRKGQISLL